MFKNLKALSYMPNPVRMLSKPYIMVLILLEVLPDLPKNFDPLQKSDCDKLWHKHRNYLKEKDFVVWVEEFDFRKLNERKVSVIERLVETDPLMTYAALIQEVKYAAYFFDWVMKVIDIWRVMQRLKKCGIHELEVRKVKAVKRIEVITEILKRLEEKGKPMKKKPKRQVVEGFLIKQL